MGNQTQQAPGQNTNQNPSQKTPGGNDQTRRDTNRTDQDKSNPQRTPGAGNNDNK